MNMINRFYLELLSEDKVQIGGGYLPLENIIELKLQPINKISILEFKHTDIKCFNIEFYKHDKRKDELPDQWITISSQ